MVLIQILVKLIIYQLKDILWAYLHPEYCQIQNLMLLQFVVYTVRSELRLLISEIYPARKKNKYMNINQIRMDYKHWEISYYQYFAWDFLLTSPHPLQEAFIPNFISQAIFCKPSDHWKAIELVVYNKIFQFCDLNVLPTKVPNFEKKLGPS